MEINEKNFKTCEICDEFATCLCFKCINYYCDSCFKFIHGKEKNKNHKKEKIDNFIPLDIKCSKHSTIPINIFCLEDKGNYIKF